MLMTITIEDNKELRINSLLAILFENSGIYSVVTILS